MTDLEYLLQLLPSSLVASLAAVQDVSLIDCDAEAWERVQFAAGIARKIEAAESATVAAAWLTTANLMLGFELPVKLIRERNFDLVTDAADSFVNGCGG